MLISYLQSVNSRAMMRAKEVVLEPEGKQRPAGKHIW